MIVISHGSLSPSGSCDTNSTEDIITEDSGSNVTNSTKGFLTDPLTEDSTSLLPVTIAAGALVAIIVLVTLTVGIVGCTRLRRRKMRLQHFLKRQVKYVVSS